jgi:hypothetical protein
MLVSDPVRLTIMHTIGRRASIQQQQSFRGPDNKASHLDRTREFLALRPGNLERLDALVTATVNDVQFHRIVASKWHGDLDLRLAWKREVLLETLDLYDSRPIAIEGEEVTVKQELLEEMEAAEELRAEEVDDDDDEIELIEGKLALSRYRSRYQVALQSIIAKRAEEIYMEGGRHTADVEVRHNLRSEIELTCQVLPVDTKATRAGRPRRTRRLLELPRQVPPSCSFRTPAEGRATAQEGESRKLHSY